MFLNLGICYKLEKDVIKNNLSLPHRYGHGVHPKRTFPWNIFTLSLNISLIITNSKSKHDQFIVTKGEFDQHYLFYGKRLIS